MDKKKDFKFKIFFTLGLLFFFIVMILFYPVSLCIKLESILDVPLFLVLTSISIYWMWKATSYWMIYLRGLIAGVLVVSAMFSLDYLTQSKYFPEFLISDASKERIEWYKQKAKEMKQEVEKRLERENNVSNN